VSIIYNIVIFGSGSTAEKVTENLNSNINILCYLDNNHSKWGSVLNNRSIVSPSKINEYEYDYIVIASQYSNEIYSQLINMNVCKELIFEYLNFLKISYNSFENKIKAFQNEPLKYETLITGISYFVTGIRGEYLSKIGINFAYDSQDLYYDYHIAKYLLENYLNKFKYGIIGLSYYSFQYDLSLSSLKDNVKLYYPRLKTSHNANIVSNDYDRLPINKNIANIILKITNEGRYKFNNKLVPLTEQNNLDDIGMNQAFLDCGKSYPKTVEENKIILKEYLKLLKYFSIKPIIVVCPTSKYYYRNFSKKIRNEFLDIISEIKKEFDFQYIDYFESELFDDSLFYDVSHLTYEGGEKFTKILNQVIDW